MPEAIFFIVNIISVLCEGLTDAKQALLQLLCAPGAGCPGTNDLEMELESARC